MSEWVSVCTTEYFAVKRQTDRRTDILNQQNKEKCCQHLLKNRDILMALMLTLFSIKLQFFFFVVVLAGVSFLCSTHLTNWDNHSISFSSTTEWTDGRTHTLFYRSPVHSYLSRWLIQKDRCHRLWIFETFWLFSDVVIWLLLLD